MTKSQKAQKLEEWTQRQWPKWRFGKCICEDAGDNNYCNFDGCGTEIKLCECNGMDTPYDATCMMGVIGHEICPNFSTACRVEARHLYSNESYIVVCMKRIRQLRYDVGKPTRYGAGNEFNL